MQHGSGTVGFPLVEHNLFRKPIATPLFQLSALHSFQPELSARALRMFWHTILVRGEGNRRKCTELIGYADCAGLNLAGHSMLDEASHWNVFIVGPPSAKYRVQGETGG
jgi:hypothetical protein